jgi:nitrite reductase/ring-hydroxylating ferredoxin subunit
LITPHLLRILRSEQLCPHRGAELYLGDVDEIKDDDMGIVWGHSITCPLHNWVFNLEDGSCDKYTSPPSTHARTHPRTTQSVD